MDVSLDLGPGEVLGLVGENGSGKSTLVKTICGYHAPDRGATGEVWGKELSFPVAADKLGIAVIHQDLGLVDEMSVLENLGIGTGYGARALGRVRWRGERRRCEGELGRFGVSLNPDAMVGTLTPPERAMVGIARAARRLRGREDADGAGDGRQIFILDEPTAYLTKGESDQVMEMIRTVAAGGSSVIFVSHHLAEITSTCDRVLVLRDGRVVGTEPSAGLTEAGLIGLMLGRELASFYPDPPSSGTGEDTILSVSGLTGSIAEDVSFDLRVGEVLGITGLAGMGQQELPYLIAGAKRRTSGSVLRGDQPVGETPAAASKAGIALVPGNRRRDGIWPEGSASENLSLPVLGRYYGKGWLRRSQEMGKSRELMETLDVRPLDERMAAKNFSGGNQQKIVLAKWLQGTPEVLLLDEPTQGVDAGARREILQIVKDVAARGTGVAIFSSDLEQLANVCTRVIVMSRGRIVSIVDGASATEDTLLSLCQSA
jgi:ribose transport system ATP-binding protein